eukprot:535125-Karenia_brevis.AAC.1
MPMGRANGDGADGNSPHGEHGDGNGDGDDAPMLDDVDRFIQEVWHKYEKNPKLVMTKSQRACAKKAFSSFKKHLSRLQS